MASADSLTRITVFVRAGMTLILTPNCTPRPVRLQGERACHRDTEAQRHRGTEGDKETHIFSFPLLLVPLCASVAGPQRRYDFCSRIRTSPSAEIIAPLWPGHRGTE